MTYFQTTTRHAFGPEVDGAVDLYFANDELIPDDVALAIAGYFASPSARDMPFTKLAQQGMGETVELGDAIQRELASAQEDEDTGIRGGIGMLKALDAWVEAHDRE